MTHFRSIFFLVFILILPASGFAARMSLLDAAKNGETETVRVLLDRGADINQRGDYEYTPLIWAIEKGHTDTAALLINRGTDVSIRTAGGYSALAAAVNKGQSGIVRLLLDKGADVNADWKDWRPLSLAALIKRPDMIKLLLSKNADVDLAVSGIESMAAKGKAIGSAEAQQIIALLLKAKDEYAAAAVKKPEAVPGSAVRSDVDDPPAVKPQPKKNAFALVIGIEEYREKLPRAEFAAHDARVFARYLITVLGYPEENVVVLTNERATKSDLEKYFHRWFPNHVTDGGEVFVYYSGHGSPATDGSDAFMVPFDGDPAYIADTGYSLKRLYAALGRLPSKDNYVVLDSCFSGAGGRSVIARGLRPLVITSMDQDAVSANTTILTASTASQVSSTYLEKGHGLLTYFVLKGLKENDPGRPVHFETLYPYVASNVERIARTAYNNEQTPLLWRGGKKAGSK
ncbi:MAG: ankyrin repeat domain-containing protein [Deltaproteobacteria bacterium]